MKKDPLPISRTTRLLAVGAFAASTLFTTWASAADPEPILNFDGIESIIQTDLNPEDLGIGGGSAKTIEAWVYTRGFNEGGVFHVGTSSTGQEFALRTGHLNDTWVAQFWGGPDTPFTVLGSSENWTHLAITYDGSISVYANGEEVATEAETLDTQGDEWQFRIGAWRGQHFHGAIRDVRVWNEARSQAEIQATMSDTSSLPQANLMAWWPMDEGEGEIVNDASGNNHHADIFAAQWEGQQLDYDPTITADFNLDFGTGAGQVDESSLLRNRPDHFSLQEDSLRMTGTTNNAISSSAVASVANHEAGQNFVLESEVSLHSVFDAGASRLGLVALGGPHVPLEAPFDTNDEEDFYTVSFFPALPSGDLTGISPVLEGAGDDTALMYIAKGFNGPYLAAARWDGRKPLPNSQVLLDDDFEDSATDADWLTGAGDTEGSGSWEIGVPTYPGLNEENEEILPLPEGSARVAATNLDATLSPNSDDWLRSPVIDLTGLERAELTYTEAMWIDDYAYLGEQAHLAIVSIVDESGVLLAELDQDWGNSGGFRERRFILPPEALGNRVRVEFRLVTDDFSPDPEWFGWMIDSLSVISVTQDTGAYALKAEGNYGYAGELELTFTLTDLEDAGLYSQSISTTIQDPLDGNLFGIGGRLQATAGGDSAVEFGNVALTLSGQPPLVPTTTTSAFYYPFGSTGSRVAPDNFALSEESDWTLQGEALQLETSAAAGSSLGVTRVSEFVPGNTIHVESDVVLSSLGAGAGGEVGLVLFGEEDPSVFDPADNSTYYSFQYIFDGVGGGKIAFRQGATGSILGEVAFTAPTAGESYRFEFTGNYNSAGELEFTASLSDQSGGDASLAGVIADSLAGRNRFGFGAAQGGGDVWNFVNFGGYTAAQLDVNFQVYRWTPLKLRSSGAIQMSEFSFYKDGVDLLDARRVAEEAMPTVTGSTPNQNESPQHMVDGDTGTKWFGNDSSQPVVFVFDQPVQIDAYMMWTANDFDSRDVVSWRLEGSNDGFEWELLDTVLDYSTPTARFTRFKDTGEFDLPTGAILNNFEVGGSGFRIARNGQPVTFSWDTAFATSVSIQPDVGQVDASGTKEVVVPESAETVFTLTAVGADGVPHTSTVTVRSVEAMAHTYQYVRFDLPDEASLRNPGSNSIQITQFEFFLGDEIVSPVSVSNPGGNTPANEPVSNLLVPSGKWLDFNKAIRRDGFAESSRVVFDFGSPVAIDGYRFITGNDATDRDPLRWRLWGRNSETEDWTLVEHIAENYPTPTARSTATQIFPLVSDPVPSPGVIDLFAIRGIGGETVDTTQMSIVKDGTTIGFAWEGSGVTNTEIQPVPGPVVRAGADDILPPQSATTTFTMSASGPGGTDTATVRVRSVPQDHFESVRYVRFNIPDNTALRNPNENSIQLSRFFFFRNGAKVNAVSATNPGGDTPSAEPAGNLIGDSNSKWLDFNRANLNDSHLVFDFGEVVEIDAYQLGTAGDANGRDPLRWRLYGRNTEEEEWRMIEDMHFNYPVPTDRYTLTEIIPLPGSSLTIEEESTFGGWADIYFEGEDRTNPDVSGPLANPAGDGIVNLLKYAFGLSPWDAVSSADLPQAELEGETLRLTYVERVGAADISYVPEKSLSLGAWDSDGLVEVSPRMPTEDGAFEWVTIELPLNGATKAFLRVNVLEVE